MTISEIINAITEIFKAQPIAQSVGLVWYAISIYTFAFCKNKKFILFLGIISIFWAIHFALIAAYSAFIVNFIDIFKNFIALKYEKNKYLFLWFLLLYLWWGIYTYTDILSLIPIFAAISWLFLAFYVRWIWLNIWFLTLLILWLFYNLQQQSLWWVASDITLLIAWIYWIITLFILKKWKNTE